MSQGIQRQIWLVRGRPGRPLRRGRSSSRTSRRTATRVVYVKLCNFRFMAEGVIG